MKCSTVMEFALFVCVLCHSVPPSSHPYICQIYFINLLIFSFSAIFKNIILCKTVQLNLPMHSWLTIASLHGWKHAQKMGSSMVADCQMLNFDWQ